jgi:hypothetical protein
MRILLKMLIFISIEVSFCLSQTIMYIDPPVIPPKAVGDTFWFSIKIADAVELYCWEAEVHFNPEVCTVLVVGEGPFMKQDGVPTLFMKDIQSGLFACGCIRGFPTPVAGAYGSGTLAYVLCRVKSEGNSYFDITNILEMTFLMGVDLSSSITRDLPFVMVDGYYGVQNENTRNEILISNAPNDQLFPDVTWGGTQYLVSWQDQKFPHNWDWRLLGQRISFSGSPIGDAISIYDSINNSASSPSLCWNDSIFSAIYKVGTRDDTVSDDLNIESRLITAEGLVESGGCITNAPSVQRDPTIASNGSKMLVVWEDHRAGMGTLKSYIYGKILNRNGSPFSPEFLIDNTPGYHCNPAVIWGDSLFLVVWTDAYNFALNGQFVDTLGNLFGPKIQIAHGPYYDWYPSVAFSGANYLVVWQKTPGYDTTDIYGQLLSPDGNLIGSNFIICDNSADQSLPEVIWLDSLYLVFWQDERNGPSDIYGQMISPDGILIGSNFPVCTAAYNQIFPSASKGYSGYFVVWSDYRNGTDYNIWGDIEATGISEGKSSAVTPPTTLNTFPNPFKNRLIIQYSQEALAIDIYNTLGQLVKSFSNLAAGCGLNQIVWDGSDNFGRPTSEGVYFLTLRNKNSNISVKKICKLK